MDDIATHWHGHGCTQPPPPPLLTQQHGMVAWLEHMRAEVRCTRFSIVAPPLSSFSRSPLPPLLFSLVFGCAPSTTLLFSPFFPLVSSPCLVFPQSWCSVCHCVIVILTAHTVCCFPPLSFSPLSHSQHTSRLHLDARLHAHGEQGCWQQHLKRTLSQRSKSPLPHVCEDTTLQLLCTARRHHQRALCSHFFPAQLASAE